MTRNSYFTILDEVSTNHVFVDNTYFTNHRREQTQIMVLKPASKLLDSVIIWKKFLSTISCITHFSVEQKFSKHHFLRTLKQQTAKRAFLTISYTLALEKYFVKLCNTSTLRRFDLACGIEVYHLEGLF